MRTFFLLFLFFNGRLYAQSDSVQIVSQEWKQEKIRKGVVWKQAHFTNLFGSEQELNFVEIGGRKNLKKVMLAGDPKTLKTTETFALEEGALVAINGGFFDMKNGGAVDLIKIRGEVITTTRQKTDRANAYFSVSQGNIKISAELPEGENAMLSGPMLLSSGREEALSKNAFNDNRHPRTAVGIKKGKKVVFLVVDGRNSQAQGMSLPELQKLMRWLGVTEAMNLDGGGSSTLYIASKGVVSYPSDNKKFDHEGQRPVANILYLKK